jgi:uncharacterized protein
MGRAAKGDYPAGPDVIDFFPDAATFAATVADPRFPIAVVISIVSGMVRGFSGFGAALVYVPLMSAVYGPRIAAPSFLIIDFFTGLVFMLTLWRQAVWREVLPLAAAALLAAQLGSLILIYADPVSLRWGISVIVLAVVPVLATGWRYHGRPILIVTIAVGLLSGLMGGAVQIYGPPVILYWLGSASDALTVRANFICYFATFASGLMVTYSLKGLLTAEATALALLIGPLQIVAQYAGSRLFQFATERTYRRVAFGIIAVAGVLGMPLLDRWLR